MYLSFDSACKTSCTIVLIQFFVIFRFLFDKNCSDYKYYEFRLAEEEMLLAQSKEAQASKHGL